MNILFWNIVIDETSTPTPPEEIVESQCENLKNLTDGRVIAKIAVYYGQTSSYTQYGFLGALRNLALAGEDREVNIQEDLGDVGKSYFTFEFFISATSAPNYKFRILFLIYEIGYYPLKIVLDEKIAAGIGVEQNITCKSEEDFKDILGKILASPKVAKVVNSLNSIALREERKVAIPF